MEEVDITVNDLSQILAAHYNVPNVLIEAIEVADFSSQYPPQTKVIGIGGILTLKITKEKKV